MGLTALDLGLRGAASGLFLMMVLVLVRLRPTNRHIILGKALATGGAAYAVATARAPTFGAGGLGGSGPALLGEEPYYSTAPLL